MDTHHRCTSLACSLWSMIILTWFKILRPNSFGGLHFSLSARERLDLNISSTFVDLSLNARTTLFQEGSNALHTARGAYAPYRIRNQTGSPILVWSELDNPANTNSIDAVKILNDQTIDWRFDDWKTMREVCILPTTVGAPLNLCLLSRTSLRLNITLAYNL